MEKDEGGGLQKEGIIKKKKKHRKWLGELYIQH